MRIFNKNLFRNKTIPLLYALGIFGFPLVSFFPVFLGVESRPISVAIRMVVVLLSLHVLFPIKKRLLYNHYFILFLVFWLLYTFRISYTFITNDEIVFFMSNFQFNAFAYGACFLPSFALFSSLQKHEWHADSIFNATFIVIFVATISSIYLGFKTGLQQSESVGRMSTSVLNPITLGHTGVSLLLLSLYRLISKNKAKKSLNLWYILGILVGILATLSAASKGPMVSFILVLFLYAIFTLKPKKLLSFFYFGLIASFFIWQSLDFLEENFGLNAFKRFEGLLNAADGDTGGDMSTDTRVHHFHDALEQFQSSPLFGSGIVEKNSGYYPHNVYLESFMSTGIIGGVIYLFLTFSMVQKSIMLLKREYDLSWAGLLAIQYSIGALFSGSIGASNPVWLSMAFVYSATIYYAQHHRR